MKSGPRSCVGFASLLEAASCATDRVDRPVASLSKLLRASEVAAGVYRMDVMELAREVPSVPDFPRAGS